MMQPEQGLSEGHVIVTGGAGYIGSVLAGRLLRRGYWVTVVDDLHYGGESLLAYLPEPGFTFVRADVCRPGVLPQAGRAAADHGAPAPTAVVHLAAIAGFPACDALGREMAWRYNVESVRQVFGDAEALGIERFVFSSTYSNYGVAADGVLVTEDSPLNPQSLYAETKIAAEDLLLQAAKSARCAPLIFRFATIFGASPRMRFDLIVNQFVLEAFVRGELLIYQRRHSRSFVHVQDVAAGVLLGLKAPPEDIRGQICNLGSEAGNHTKDEIVEMIRRALPDTRVVYKDMAVGGDMRDVRVSFAKVRQALGFRAERSVEQGIGEVLDLLRSGLIRDPLSDRYRNATFIVP
jgi:nucleoside-diphosphate-sugar epimerase